MLTNQRDVPAYGFCQPAADVFVDAPCRSLTGSADAALQTPTSGAAINLAARPCDGAEDGEILLSPRAGIAVEDAYELESRGETSLKGIREPLAVFRLSGAAAT